MYVYLYLPLAGELSRNLHDPRSNYSFKHFMHQIELEIQLLSDMRGGSRRAPTTQMPAATAAAAPHR